MLTFDQMAFDGVGKPQGMKLGGSYTKDGKSYDNTGAFLENELSRIDPKMHMPLIDIQYDRDIDIRSDVTMADEFSSFTVSTFGGAGGLGTGNSITNGKHWIGRNSTAISGVSVDIGLLTKPLRPWAIELAFDIFQIESSAKLGRPIDQQKFYAMQRMHEMEADEQAYVGDVPNGDTGLVNSTSVTPVNVAVGNAGSTAWSLKTPSEILADVNTAAQAAWAATGFAVMPEKLLLPPAQYGAISTAIISAAGNQSVMKYLQENWIGMAKEGKKLDIQPVKWLQGAGVGGTLGTPGIDRMVVYTKREEFVRFPYVPMQRTPVEFRGLFHISNYYGKMGVVEIVYPQTLYYADGI
jgi:hypothetical protein